MPNSKEEASWVEDGKARGRRAADNEREKWWASFASHAGLSGTVRVIRQTCCRNKPFGLVAKTLSPEAQRGKPPERGTSSRPLRRRAQVGSPTRVRGSGEGDRARTPPRGAGSLLEAPSITANRPRAISNRFPAQPPGRMTTAHKVPAREARGGTVRSPTRPARDKKILFGARAWLQLAGAPGRHLASGLTS